MGVMGVRVGPPQDGAFLYVRKTRFVPFDALKFNWVCMFNPFGLDFIFYKLF